MAMAETSDPYRLWGVQFWDSAQNGIRKEMAQVLVHAGLAIIEDAI